VGAGLRGLTTAGKALAAQRAAAPAAPAPAGCSMIAT
jgi:hypothetical protein